MTVDLFIPCFINHLLPDTAWSVVKILKKANIDVAYNPSHGCCGQPTFNSGFWPQTKEMAEKFIHDFPQNRPIIVPSASCAAFIRNHYPKLFKHDEAQLANLERIKKNVIELSDFLVNHIHYTDTDASFPHRVTYHDGCSALREYGLKSEPRKLLNSIKDIELVEMEETETCCGFGGTFMVKYTALSTAMAEQKVANALKTGAEYIVSSEASCLINIKSYIDKNKLPIQTLHLADVLAATLYK